MAEFNEWSCCDYDACQFGRLVGYREYEFWEVEEVIPLDANETRSFIAKNMVVSLDDYSIEEITNIITGYYESLDETCKHYGTEYEWIIAECIFEQATTYDADFCTELMSEEEARHYVLGIVLQGKLEGRDEDEAEES